MQDTPFHPPQLYTQHQHPQYAAPDQSTEAPFIPYDQPTHPQPHPAAAAARYDPLVAPMEDLLAASLRRVRGEENVVDSYHDFIRTIQLPTIIAQTQHQHHHQHHISTNNSTSINMSTSTRNSSSHSPGVSGPGGTSSDGRPAAIRPRSPHPTHGMLHVCTG